MSLEDTLRWSKRWPMPSSYRDAGYQTRDPFGPGEADVNWRWLSLWKQENPDPRLDEDLPAEDAHEAFERWYDQQEKVRERCWVAKVLPQFKVWDWTEDDVASARQMIRGHVCGVCGRSDDPGCAYGC